jgi:hypothetical protein
VTVVKRGSDVLHIPTDFDRDPSGGHLGRLLAARQAHAHALVRRSFLAHVTAPVGVPLWFAAAGIGPAWLRMLGLFLFPPLLIGYVTAVVAEVWWRGRLRDEEILASARRSGEGRRER